MGMILSTLGVALAVLLRNHLLGLIYVLVYLVLLVGSYSVVWLIVALFINRS
jgi:hypothetical protein